jgi:hypothetical protein
MIFSESVTEDSPQDRMLDIFNFKISPAVRTLMVYSESTATMLFTKSNIDTPTTRTRVKKGLSLCCLCGLTWEPHQDVDIRLRIQGEDIEVREDLFDASYFEDYGFGGSEKVTKLLYISDRHSPQANCDPLGDASTQQRSVLRFQRDNAPTPESARDCRSVHRNLRCHVMNREVQENFLLHSSVLTLSQKLLRQRTMALRSKAEAPLTCHERDGEPVVVLVTEEDPLDDPNFRDY